MAKKETKQHEETYRTLRATRHFDSLKAGEEVYANPSELYWSNQLLAGNVEIVDVESAHDVLTAYMNSEEFLESLEEATIPAAFDEDD